MTKRDFLYFNKLKKHIVRKLRLQFPEVESDISSWKGREISLFQVDLEKRVQGRISQKWFYTHLKSKAENLPRIDILDLLSKYVGFENWVEFKQSNPVNSKPSALIWPGLSMLALLIIAVYIYVFEVKDRQYRVRFVDVYTNRPIEPEKLVITQFFEDQSPKKIDCEEDGTYLLSTNQGKIKFVVDAPFYKSDTITRKLGHSSGDELVRLHPNDFELIFHYLTNHLGEEWERRRAQLSDMIDDQAVILQLSEDLQYVIEMYQKADFINKLTIPTSSLKKIEIVDIKYSKDRIVNLRFIQKKGGEND